MPDLSLFVEYCWELVRSAWGIAGALTTAFGLWGYFASPKERKSQIAADLARRIVLPLGLVVLVVAQFLVYQDLHDDFQAAQSPGPDLHVVNWTYDLQPGFEPEKCLGRRELYCSVQWDVYWQITNLGAEAISIYNVEVLWGSTAGELLLAQLADDMGATGTRIYSTIEEWLRDEPSDQGFPETLPLRLDGGEKKYAIVSLTFGFVQGGEASLLSRGKGPPQEPCQCHRLNVPW